MSFRDLNFVVHFGEHFHRPWLELAEPNAVKTQVWVAVSVYVLVAIVKKRLGISRSLPQILQILSISIFEQIHITQALTEDPFQIEGDRCHNHLPLFNF